jgi:hypothetical protein
MTDLANRCESRNPHDSEWSRMVESRIRWKARCVKEAGHDGPHLGPDESTWQDSVKETIR